MHIFHVSILFILWHFPVLFLLFKLKIISLQYNHYLTIGKCNAFKVSEYRKNVPLYTGVTVGYAFDLICFISLIK